jgi:hypothetical protein
MPDACQLASVPKDSTPEPCRDLPLDDRTFRLTHPIPSHVTTTSTDPCRYGFFVWGDRLAPGTAPLLAGRGFAFFALINRPVLASRPTLIDVAFVPFFTMCSPHGIA